MIRFGMSNTLLTFVDKYYKYGGSVDPNKRGLTIGGYEFAWLADLVASFILEKTEDLFEKTTDYVGIYRDDGLIAFKGKWNVREIQRWLKTFQLRVFDICGSEDLIFTSEIWMPTEETKATTKKISKTISTVYAKYFPYLDMEVFWNNDDELNFKVHMKENQKLKYLNRDSTHRNSCFKAIPWGVFGRLARLTSTTRRALKQKMEDVYPDHYAALKRADLAPKDSPTLKKMLKLIKISNEKKGNKKRGRTNVTQKTYFCVGVSNAFKGKNAIHVLLKSLRDKHNLKWLRTSMSYHKFSNLRELLSGDLTGKIMKDVVSLDFIDRECNCNKASLVKGECIYGGNCRKSIVVY